MEHEGQGQRTISARALLVAVLLVAVLVGGFVAYGQYRSDQAVDRMTDDYLGG